MLTVQFPAHLFPASSPSKRIMWAASESLDSILGAGANVVHIYHLQKEQASSHQKSENFER